MERFGWISSQTFTNIITISQMTPGPLAVNASTFVGMQIAGIPGAVFATAGCVVSGVVVSVLRSRDEAVAASAAPRGPAKGRGSATGAQASSMITIRVADDGPGIPADIRDRVFDRFVRGDSSRTRDGRGSSGLGMSIVESLARAMGGSVRLVDSEKGTVIDVTLPAA